jgi:uncharacterized protein
MRIAMRSFAFDRASSSQQRSFDVDGRLHVASAPISAASVDGYLGSEIPGGDEIGLNPSLTYQLLRDPDELRAAASTFNGIPILSTHVPVSASDHQPSLVVGAVGTDCTFEDPYLIASLTVWSQAAIDGIEDGTCRGLSCGYRYTPVMEPGTWRGIRYDMRMSALVANHLSLVESGRVAGARIAADARRAPRSFLDQYPDAARIVNAY